MLQISFPILTLELELYVVNPFSAPEAQVYMVLWVFSSYKSK